MQFKKLRLCWIFFKPINFIIIIMSNVIDDYKISELSENDDERLKRIIADHIRAVVFVLGDGNSVTPSNLGHGYIIRRLLRRAIRHSMQLNMKDSAISQIADLIIGIYPDYPELEKNK